MFICHQNLNILAHLDCYQFYVDYLIRVTYNWSLTLFSSSGWMLFALNRRISRGIGLNKCHKMIFFLFTGFWYQVGDWDGSLSMTEITFLTRLLLWHFGLIGNGSQLIGLRYQTPRHKLHFIISLGPLLKIDSSVIKVEINTVPCFKKRDINTCRLGD